MKVSKLIERYEEVSALPKSLTDRRRKRPEGALHIDELRLIARERLPKGLALKLYTSTWNPTSVEVSIVRDGATSTNIRYSAFTMTYWDYSYLETDSSGWVREDYIRSTLERLEREILEFQTNIMRAYRAQKGLSIAAEPASLKGKPRRKTKPGNFESYYEGLMNSRTGKLNVIDLMPTVPALGAASRTWGIEIEVAGARGVLAPHDWVATEDGSLRSPYTTDDCSCECSACSLYNEHDCGEEECPGYNNEDDSKEFVSPILSNLYAPGIDQICTDVRFEPQNDTAGVHVHVGTDNMTPKQIGGLVYAYGLLERMLESSYTRSERDYCEALTAEDVRRVLSKARKVTHRRDMNVLDRYVTVNVQALSKHGTIEFRAMGPVYDSEYLHKWAMFCREMVNVAASNAPQAVWNNIRDFEDVLNVFRKYGKEVNAIEAEALARAEKIEAVASVNVVA